MICMIIRHVKMATWSEIEEKVIFSSKMWSLFGRIFDLLEKCDKFLFFSVQKKLGESCPKFKPSRLKRVVSMFFRKK